MNRSQYKPINVLGFAVMYIVVMTLVGCAQSPSSEHRVYQWLVAQQHDVGLLGNQEDDTLASVYTNAVAAICFTHKGDYERSRAIFDYYDARVAQTFGDDTLGGFYQFSQLPSGDVRTETDRWMGDNAWLLIALNHYRHVTGDKSYDPMRDVIAQWIIRLQDQNGGIMSGYREGDKLADWFVTEANLDCYAALIDYPEARRRVYDWLMSDMWIAAQRRFRMGSPDDNTALDGVSWAIAALGVQRADTLDYAEATFARTDVIQPANVSINGFSDYSYKQHIWFEGTGQMALAYRIVGREADAQHLLREMEKAMMPSGRFVGTIGLPCVTSDPPWVGADRKIFVASQAWYLMAKWNLNPMNLSSDPS